MKRKYTARAIKVWPPESGSNVPRSVVSEYSHHVKEYAIAWCVDVVIQHGEGGLTDSSVDEVECWSDDPDDGWKISVSADAEGFATLLDAMAEEASV